ncbi:hypothetical protein BN1723_014230 [Verticillium longisporum]|uniref:Methylated-DNA-[protein]-cysteine S-methyltransferase DNA binding domain-containing protein n=1 Tax=Verticillium longisporum TaxID=100787 RepID=A0A0G4M475_VERLO|nr:hypothetical protein BN1723_014230 [Verticillium longisporum]
MSRQSEQAQAFAYAVYAAVQEIPRGKVTSYGHIAALIGTPERPRQVGTAEKLHAILVGLQRLLVRGNLLLEVFHELLVGVGLTLVQITRLDGLF